MQLATAARFEPGGDWYSEGYRRFPFFAERAAWVHATAPAGNILVAGAAYGYLVDELAKLGRDAWGIDASAYAVERAVVPGRILQRSALVRADLTAARTAAGLAGASRFAAGVTEDLLPCLTVAEVANALGELRRACTTLLHIVTPGDGQAQPPGRAPEMTWRTVNDWRQIVGADPVYSAEAGAA